MNPDFIAYSMFSVGFLMIFALGDTLYNYVKIVPELSRKTVHVLSGLLACLFPLYFSDLWWVLAMCISFVLLLLLSLRFNFLKGINSVERKTYGSTLYPLGVFLSYAFYYIYANKFAEKPLFLFHIPLLILTLSDPLAALTGKRFPIKRFNTQTDSKSWGGSTAFLLSAFLVSYLLLPGHSQNVFFALMLAVITTLAEAFSRKGSDNFFISSSAVAVLYILVLH